MNQNDDFSLNGDTRSNSINQYRQSSINSNSDDKISSASNGASAMLLPNGRVIAWGDERYGGQIPLEIAQLQDIVSISATRSSFAALRANRSVVAWGFKDRGGEVPSEIAELQDIVSLSATGGAFTALRTNRSVVTWGDPNWGGGGNPRRYCPITGYCQYKYNRFCFRSFAGES